MPHDRVATKLDTKNKSNAKEGAAATNTTSVAHEQLTRDFNRLDVQDDGKKQAANTPHDSSFSSSSRSSSISPVLHSIPYDIVATVDVAVAESSLVWSSFPSSPPSHDTSDFELDYFMRLILDYSYRQAGRSNSYESAAAGRRAKILIEHPEEAKAFVCMVLRDYPYLDSLKIIQMVDYYSLWLSNGMSGYV